MYTILPVSLVGPCPLNKKPRSSRFGDVLRCVEHLGPIPQTSHVSCNVGVSQAKYPWKKDETHDGIPLFTLFKNTKPLRTSSNHIFRSSNLFFAPLRPEARHRATGVARPRRTRRSRGRHGGLHLPDVAHGHGVGGQVGRPGAVRTEAGGGFGLQGLKLLQEAAVLQNTSVQAGKLGVL